MVAAKKHWIGGRHALALGLAATLVLHGVALAQNDGQPERPPYEGSGEGTGEPPGADEAESAGASEGTGRDQQSTLGTMPTEELPPPDAAQRLAEPLPRPETLTEQELAELTSFEAALARYAAEMVEYRDDLEHLVESEYAGRRADVQEVFEDEIALLRGQEREHRAEVIARLEDFLLRYPNRPPETPDAMFRLAELYFEKESDDYVVADAAYAEQLDLYEAGRLQGVPDEPEKRYTQTIATFQRLVSEFPDYRQVDGAYYLMGYAQLQMTREDEAVASFQTLVARFPESAFAQEAWVRIGEYHFETNDYETAAAAYQRGADYGEGRLYDEALFKLGWSFYLMNEYPRALETFRTLITYYEASGDEAQSGALREEALQYMAVALAEEDWDLDGERDPGAGIARLEAELTTGADWERDVTERLANVWFDNERYELAIEMYRHILDRWPTDRQNPERHERIVASLSRLGQFEQAFDEQAQMAQLYGPGSGWYRTQEEAGNIRAMAYADEMVRTATLDTARFYNQEADQLRDQASTTGDPDLDRQALERYRLAANSYGEFLESYPSDRESYEVRFLYAQALYYSFEFLEAAQQYALVRDEEGDSRRRELAAYQVVRSLELAIRREIEAGDLPARALPTYQAQDEAVAEALASEEGEAESASRTAVREAPRALPVPALTEALVAAYDRYVALGLNSGDDPTTQGRFAYLAGKVYFDFHDYPVSRQRFEAILDNAVYRCQEEAIYAASLIIESFRLEGDYESMEAWGQRLQATDFCEGQVDMALLQEFMEEAETMRVGAIFRSAEDLFQAEQYEEASQEYVRLVNQNPTSEFAPAALYNAAVGYERTLHYEPAMRMYQRIVDDYPQCEFVNDALNRVAINSRRFFDFERATHTYQLLAQRADAEDDIVRNALLSAAELEENSRRYATAAQTYRRFAERFSDDELAPTALYRAGRMFEEDDNPAEMASAWGEMRAIYGGLAPTEQAPIDSMVLDSLRREAEAAEARGDSASARLLYESLLDEYLARDPSDVDSRFAAGKARFYLAQQDFDRWAAIAIEGSVQRQRQIVQDLVAEIPQIAASYNEVIDVGSAEWTMAAYFMVGRVYQSFADRVYAVPIPEFDDPDLEEAYQMELEDFASRFEDEAVENWRVAIEVARQTGIVNEWTISIIRELNRYLGNEFPLYKEEPDFIQEGVISPLAIPLPEGLEPIQPFQEEEEGLEDLDDAAPPSRTRRRPPSDDGIEELEDLDEPAPRREQEPADDDGLEDI